MASAPVRFVVALLGALWLSGAGTPLVARGQPHTLDARVVREVARAESLRARGQRRAAERAIGRALQLDPTSTAAVDGLGRTLLPPLDELLPAPDRATQLRATRVLTALEQVPPDRRQEQLQLTEATALAATGDHRDALRVLARAPRLSAHTLAPALDAVALLALERGDADTCEQALRLAIELQPDAGRALRLADVLLARGDATRAVTLLHAALAFEPESVALHLGLATAQLTSGDTVSADETLARALPRCPLRCAALRAWVALEAGDTTLAAQRARDLLALPQGSGEPETADAIHRGPSEPPRVLAGYVLGLALARQGQLAPARQALEEVLRLAPGHAGARQALRALAPSQPQP